MKIVFFRHPPFMASQSMPRYADWLSRGMLQRGHEVESWTPSPRFYNLPVPAPLKKWLGYIDQYIMFPWMVKKKLKSKDADTLFVFSDHALGPWVPLVVDRKHLIHCHDFLAQRSALGQIPENPTSFTGKRLQSFIRKGFQRGRHFISISKRTQDDLHSLLVSTPVSSHLVYNGIPRKFIPGRVDEVRQTLTRETGINLVNGYLLHVGGNQWYKNRKGVVELYSGWRASGKGLLPLLMIGPEPGESLQDVINNSGYKDDIHLLTGRDDVFVQLCYQGAELFLFPSMAEGFGWPIIEAMASGVPVITTNETPMTEVGGNAAFYIPRYYRDKMDHSQWVKDSVDVMVKVLSMTGSSRKEVVERGFANAARFNSDETLDRIETIYKKIMANN
ncbi:MAG: glycosyltransferase [Chitinophagaceae bacterium]